MGEYVKYQHYVDAINYISGNNKKLSDNYLTDDFISLLASVNRDMLRKLLTKNPKKTCNTITCADTFFIVYKNLNAYQQQQLLIKTKKALDYAMEKKLPNNWPNLSDLLAANSSPIKKNKFYN